MSFEFVQYEELKEIFQCRKVTILCGILEKEGIPYLMNSKNRPMVARDQLAKRIASGSTRDDREPPTSPTP
jgi:hypothetical protein